MTELATLDSRDRHTRATDRLILARPERADAARIARLANERALAENTSRIPHPYRLSDAEAWLDTVAAMAPEDAPMGIYLNIPDPVLIGAVGIEQGTFAPDPELGYWIGAPYRGRGFATEAARAMIAHAFEHRGLSAIGAGCRITNIASRRVLEACGFAFIGLGRQYLLALDRKEPMDRFRLTRQAWLRRHG
ncbi:GNAT family N-acetyltransferase [Kaustia mangrovi]|uniref:GNAT family N-acetyltransferase n=1 Tax=Kaustia mangrovi TaxID=2593653 RepID=A0A7S8HCI1_9HYPH|nr:GNAT family N-acetyltransferase [Kaustia mangrovi]QPC43651.1 GNAT family N-acetyltransferase [Kaustia mangrovi]